MDGLSEFEMALLDAAVSEARQSQEEGGIPIGAALGDPSGTVIARGHNLRVQTGDPTAHAEMACIRNAGRRRDWHQLTMATTLSPCAMCTGTAVLHQIPRVIIAENESFQGREDWLRDEGVQVVVVNDPRCRALMAQFMRAHADLWNEDIGLPG